jgi:hypothetical protein
LCGEKHTGKKPSVDGLAPLIPLEDILLNHRLPPFLFDFVLEELEKVGIVFPLAEIRTAL